MAKQCLMQRNERRQRVSNNHYAKRMALKAKVADPNASYEDKMAARDALNALPKDGSTVRVRSRCVLTGRPRGVHRKFKLCRIKLRDMASVGLLPGVVKSSW